MLDAVGTVLKGGERFLELLILLVTLHRNSVLSSSLNVVRVFYGQ